MIENLLYPKKLTLPPQLDINPAAMFGEITIGGQNGAVNKKKVSLIRVQTDNQDVAVKFIEILPAEDENTPPNASYSALILSVRIPLMKSGSASARLSTGFIPLPFSYESIDRAGLTSACYGGWHNSNADLTSVFDEVRLAANISTEEKIKINRFRASMPPKDKDVISELGSGNLFHMHGDDLIDGGNGPSFKSLNGLCVIGYEIGPDVYNNLSNDESYTVVFNACKNGIVALELNLAIWILGVVTNDGFTIGASTF